MKARIAAVLLTLALAAPAAADDTVLRVSAPHALVPIVTELAQEFGASQALKVEISERSSNAAGAAIKNGDVDVAFSDSAVTDAAITDTRIAAVPFALVVNPAAGVTSLSPADIAALFDGKVADWKAIGGASLAISRVERPRRSATEVLLERAFALDPKRPAADTIEDASSSVVADVRTTSGAIGVIGLPFAGDLSGVATLAIGSVRYDAAPLSTKTYPLIAYEHALTAGAPTLAISRFLAFVRASSSTWRKAGFIPLRDLQ
jgi:phosphate transport system substrate-binding protein